MQDVMPSFRADVTIDVHHENGQSYVVLNDPYGIAEGPIMVHADMVDILEHCDGQTTWTSFAQMQQIDADGQELLRVKNFVTQLDSMGYFDTSTAHNREREMISSWNASPSRPPVCAGSTYPDDVDELRLALSELCTPSSEASLTEVHVAPRMILMPHIDFRVAGDCYAAAAHHIRNSNANLVVMIGTSHYWADDVVIPTEKNYSTPLGELQTNKQLVRKFSQTMFDRGLQVPQTDLAHKPEHSLELHALLLQYLKPDANMSVMPILVGGDAVSNANTIGEAATVLRYIVEESGKDVLWLVSGDMSHYGRRFGDNEDASAKHHEVTATDRQLLEHIRQGDIGQFHTAIASTNNSTNICGHGPLLLAMLAAQPTQGTALTYELWDDVQTNSAVTFASVVW